MNNKIVLAVSLMTLSISTASFASTDIWLGSSSSGGTASSETPGYNLYTQSTPSDLSNKTSSSITDTINKAVKAKQDTLAKNFRDNAKNMYSLCQATNGKDCDKATGLMWPVGTYQAPPKNSGTSSNTFKSAPKQPAAKPPVQNTLSVTPKVSPAPANATETAPSTSNKTDSKHTPLNIF